MTLHPLVSLIVDRDEEDVQMKETTVFEQKKTGAESYSNKFNLLKVLPLNGKH